MFDVSEAGFIPRLLAGRMMYYFTLEDAGQMIRGYAEKEDRTIVRQDLDLTPEQFERLRQYLANNYKEENRKYRYDYYRDNCSTRVRDAIDYAIGGELSQRFRGTPTDSTYRSETRRLTARAWGWNLALTTVMGHPIDRPIDAYERAFVPSRLSDLLGEFRFSDGRPLVTLRTVVHASNTRKPEPAWVPFYGWLNLAIGAVYAALIAAAGVFRRRFIAWGLITIWCVVGGVGSLVGSWGWAFTDHAVAAWNENLLVLPLPLFLLPILLAVSLRSGRASRWTRGLAIGMFALTTLAVALKLLPSVRQPNAEVWMLAWPIHASTAVAVSRLVRPMGRNDETNDLGGDDDGRARGRVHEPQGQQLDPPRQDRADPAAG
jgi:hypothetical protein